MNILLDIGHPAHVHLYRNFYSEMVKRGHEITVTVKDIPAATLLLDYYRIPYIIIGKRGSTIAGKGINQLKFNFKLLSIVYDKKIRIGVGSSISNCHVSRISSMKSILFDDDDDEVQPLMTRFGHPFAHCVLSPDALKGKRRKKDTIYYPGYHELAYLHPARFKPDKSVLDEAEIKEGESFFILRFNAFKAHHDVGIRGLSVENKRDLVHFLSDFGKVIITTENEPDDELQPYILKIAPHRIHSLLYYSEMFIGDSQTMTSEAAVTGTPSLRCNSFAGRISYLQEQEDKYGLTFSFKPDQYNIMKEKIRNLLNNKQLKEEWKEKKLRMLKDKIDVTAFMVWFVENYPESCRIINKNPDFQYNFAQDLKTE